MWAPREVEISLAWPKMRKSVWKEQDLGLLLIFDLLLWSVWAGRCWIGAPTYICWPGQASGGQQMSCKTRHVWADGSAPLHTDILVFQTSAPSFFQPNLCTQSKPMWIQPIRKNWGNNCNKSELIILKTRQKCIPLSGIHLLWFCHN